MLQAAAADLTAELDLEVLLDRLAERAAALFHVPAVSVMLWEPEGEMATIYASRGLSSAYVAGQRIPRERAEQVLATANRRPFIVDLRTDPLGDRDLILQEDLYNALAAPFVFRGRLLGSLNLYGKGAPRKFTEDELRLAGILADQMAIAIENARLFQETRRRADEMAALLEVDRQISSTLDLPRLLELIASQAQQVLQADHSDLYLIEEDGKTLQAVVSIGEYALDVMATPLQVGNGIVGLVAQTGQAEMVNRADLDPRAVRVPNTPDHPQALLCAPLVSRGQVIGVLALSRMGGREFVQADLDFLVGLARQATIAMENARLFQAAQQRAETLARRTEALSQLVEFSRTLATSLEMETILDHLVRRMGDHFEAAVTTVALTSEGEEGDPPFRIAAVYDRTGQLSQEGWAIPTARSPALAHVIRERRPLFIGDLALAPFPDLFLETEREAVSCLQLHAVLILPLLCQEEAIGAVSLWMRRIIRRFPDGELDWAMAVADQAALALQNARLYAESQQQAREMAAALERQQELDRLQRQFIQNVSHELRTPLALVQGYVELLHAGDLGPLDPTQHQTLSIVADKVKVLARLVESITALQEIESGPLTLRPLSLVEVAQTALKGVQQTARRAGVELVLEVADELPPVRGDRARLGLVFHHLLENAIKFSPDGGQVRVRLSADSQVARIEVSDQGVGISPDQQERIFDRFYQVDGSATRRFGGAGLGLAVVKEIVLAHGGRVGVESQTGRGSTFTVELPLAPLQDADIES
ncbi:MAG: GAF domain-containing protein [Chloroflexi bacterium]|nr:MAG: GAF domain-containing protein [Chloroflexota bacterium]